MLLQERLKELLHYDPYTGVFTRLVKTSNRVQVGDIAGSDNGDGYIKINLDGGKYYAHRLAFLYMTGGFNSEFTDHINGVRDDNRWLNLRAVTPADNVRNSKMAKNNTSGVVGVFWNKKYERWEAKIKLTGKYKFLGYFNSIHQAAIARKNAEIKYGFHANHGRTFNG